MITKRQRYIQEDEFRYRDDHLHDYLKSKARDIPKEQHTPVGDALRTLDVATIQYLHHGGTLGAVDDAFEAVLKTPGNDWTREELEYRQRQTHYT